MSRWFIADGKSFCFTIQKEESDSLMGVGEPRKLLSLAMRQQFGGRCCGSPSGCYDGMMLLASNCDRGVGTGV
ncbi:hypothetical protein [Bartonella sp. ML71XJBT]|uniref:hypothetical protein n=1 Tax=Bartonella sp. ML71XJBT TaxID=3019094 RepID=UPI002362101A|nr:hypothetical protein [Bartonella sp. ML71XJBT]